MKIVKPGRREHQTVTIVVPRILLLGLEHPQLVTSRPTGVGRKSKTLDGAFPGRQLATVGTEEAYWSAQFLRRLVTFHTDDHETFMAEAASPYGVGRGMQLIEHPVPQMCPEYVIDPVNAPSNFSREFRLDVSDREQRGPPLEEVNLWVAVETRRSSKEKTLHYSECLADGAHIQDGLVIYCNVRDSELLPTPSKLPATWTPTHNRWDFPCHFLPNTRMLNSCASIPSRNVILSTYSTYLSWQETKSSTTLTRKNQ